MFHRSFIRSMIVLLVFSVVNCSPKAEIDPPLTTPLSRSVLGYGVVTASYTRVMNEPGTGGVSLGYVRENTILTVLERKLIKEGELLQYWVLTDGNYRGWLPESVIKVYDTIGKARTASAH